MTGYGKSKTTWQWPHIYGSPPHSHLTESQGLPKVGNVIKTLQFRHTTAQQEREEVDKKAGMLSNGQVSLVAHLLEPAEQASTGEQVNIGETGSETGEEHSRPLKLFGLGGFLNSFTDDNEEVLSQDEGNPLSLVTKLLLLVVQEVAKVNVEQLGGEEEESVVEPGGGQA